MSRIATVDVFLMFFLMWSLVAYSAALVLPMKAGREDLFSAWRECWSGLPARVNGMP